MNRIVRRPLVRLVAAVAFLAAVSGCSSDSGSSAAVDQPSATSPSATTVAAAPAVVESAATEPVVTEPVLTEPPAAPAPTEAPAIAARSAFAGAPWTEVAGDETCMCAGGDPWKMWVRDADPSKVVMYFEGGGACFTAEMCGPASRSYDRTVDGADDPGGFGGIFDFTNPANPFADWSFVFVPYCTGDVHIGDSTHDYGNGVVVEHNGIPNAMFALDQLVSRYGSAGEVFVTGSSAGGVPAPLFGALAADRMPDAAVTALADGSGAYPAAPGINAGIGALWGTFDARPDWPETAALTPDEWSIPGLFAVAGTHDPDLVLARHDHAFDEVQAQFSSLAGIEASQLDTLIDANAAMIEAAGVPVATYVAAGTDHTILGRDEMYTQVTEGTSFLEWLTALAARRPVEDVHCTTCT